MIIDFRIDSDHQVRNQPRCIGVRGDHLTNILRVTFCDCAVKFTKAVVHFILPNGKKVKTEEQTVNDAQSFDYAMPHTIFDESGEVSISVEGICAEGRTFNSKPKVYDVCDGIDGDTVIVTRIEELEERLHRNAMLSIAKLNTMKLGLEI